MTPTPEVIDLHAVPHPAAPVRQVGFPLDHPYVEHCWTPVLGPSSTLLLRRCAWLWRDSEPASVRLEELAGQLGLGKGVGRSSPIWHTVERVVRFRFAAMPSPRRPSSTSTPRCRRSPLGSSTGCRRGAGASTSDSWASTSTGWPDHP